MVLVGAAVVVDACVVVVAIDVVVLDGEQPASRVTDADPDVWNPSDQIACTVSVTSPVSPPGTEVIAEVLPLPGTSE